MTEKFYAKTEWPEAEVIAPLVNDGACIHWPSMSPKVACKEERKMLMFRKMSVSNAKIGEIVSYEPKQYFPNYYESSRTLFDSRVLVIGDYPIAVKLLISRRVMPSSDQI